MYGYNAVIVIEGLEKYNKAYYGPSFSIGLEFRSSKLKNYFNAEILILSGVEGSIRFYY